jgi:hypothetical protein
MREKEIHAGFAVTATVKVTVKVLDKDSAKMENALNLWVADMNRNTFHLTALCCP